LLYAVCSQTGVCSEGFKNKSVFAVCQALGHHCTWTKSFETQPPVHKLLYENSYFIFTCVDS